MFTCYGERLKAVRFSGPGGFLCKYRFIAVKEGYDLRSLERRMQDVTLEPIEKCCNGILWEGVRKYLLEKE